MVQYVYDAWGNHAVLDANGADITDVDHIGSLNPFRYRGYFYDAETGLYFLKTRYYDPETGRFITIDDISYIDPETINGLNLYAYCGNNPVMRTDKHVSKNCKVTTVQNNKQLEVRGKFKIKGESPIGNCSGAAKH